MADFNNVHVVYSTFQVFDKVAGVTSASLPDIGVIWRRTRPSPFNVISPEAPRPSVGQIWPRGQANPYSP